MAIGSKQVEVYNAISTKLHDPIIFSKSHTYDVQRVVFSHTDKVMASTDGKTVFLYNIAKKQVDQVFEYTSRSNFVRMQIDLSDSFLFLITNATATKIAIETKAEAPLPDVVKNNHISAANRIVNHTGNFIFVANGTEILQLKVDSGDLEYKYDAPGTVMCVYISDDEQTLIVATDNKMVVFFYIPKSGDKTKYHPRICFLPFVPKPYLTISGVSASLKVAVISDESKVPEFVVMDRWSIYRTPRIVDAAKFILGDLNPDTQSRSNKISPINQASLLIGTIPCIVNGYIELPPKSALGNQLSKRTAQFQYERRIATLMHSVVEYGGLLSGQILATLLNDSIRFPGDSDRSHYFHNELPKCIGEAVFLIPLFGQCS